MPSRLLTALSVVGAAMLPAAPVTAAPRVAPDPHAASVLINKQVRLPAGFRPSRLVVPAVRFTFSGYHEKRQLRRDAAHALRRLFAAARRNRTALAAVSGYRSEQTQRDVFDYNVGRLGLEAAERVSARPGHSEHQTGLAIDVTGADGRCPASSCFAGTRPARWLAANAWRFGFIIRYPAGAEAITGYRYEPWHLRYLGRSLAADVASSRLPYERYLMVVRDRE